MTDPEIVAYLADNGYPSHIVRGGKLGLIARYRKFVEEVERGYRYGLEDYRNDLDLRGVISLVGSDEEVRAEDDRLRAMLAESGRRLWESNCENPFWDFGYPRNAHGELRRDLEAEGLL